MHLRPLAAILLAVAGTAVAFAALPAPASHAAACPGNLIFSQPIRDGQSRAIGELDIYWNAAAGTNCAVTNHGGRTWGKSYSTSVTLWRCAKNEHQGDFCSSGLDQAVWERNYFAFQAGPVSMYTANRCIFAAGEIVIDGIPYATYTSDLRRARFCH